MGFASMQHPLVCKDDIKWLLSLTPHQLLLLLLRMVVVDVQVENTFAGMVLVSFHLPRVRRRILLSQAILLLVLLFQVVLLSSLFVVGMEVVWMETPPVVLPLPLVPQEQSGVQMELVAPPHNAHNILDV